MHDTQVQAEPVHDACPHGGCNAGTRTAFATPWDAIAMLRFDLPLTSCLSKIYC